MIDATKTVAEVMADLETRKADVRQDAIRMSEVLSKTFPEERATMTVAQVEARTAEARKPKAAVAG